MNPFDRLDILAMLQLAIPEAEWGGWVRDLDGSTGCGIRGWWIEALNVWGEPKLIITDHGHKGFDRSAWLECMHPEYEDRRGTRLDCEGPGPVGRYWRIRMVRDFTDMWRHKFVRMTLAQLRRFGSVVQFGPPGHSFHGKAWRTHGHRRWIMQGNPKLRPMCYIDDHPGENTDETRHWTMGVWLPVLEDMMKVHILAIVLVEEPVPCQQAIPPRARAAMAVYANNWPGSSPFGRRRVPSNPAISYYNEEMITAVTGRWG